MRCRVLTVSLALGAILWGSSSLQAQNVPVKPPSAAPSAQLPPLRLELLLVDPAESGLKALEEYGRDLESQLRALDAYLRDTRDSRDPVVKAYREQALTVRAVYSKRQANLPALRALRRGTERRSEGYRAESARLEESPARPFLSVDGKSAWAAESARPAPPVRSYEFKDADQQRPYESVDGKTRWARERRSESSPADSSKDADQRRSDPPRSYESKDDWQMEGKR